MLCNAFWYDNGMYFALYPMYKAIDIVITASNQWRAYDEIRVTLGRDRSAPEPFAFLKEKDI